MLPLWNDATTALRNAGALANLLASVHPDEAVIERAEALEVAVRSYETDLYLDPDVYAALASVQPGELDDGAARLLTKVLQSFCRSGVDRDEQVRGRVRELEARLTELGQTFSRNIRDGRAITRVPSSALAGLPADYVAAHPAHDDGNGEHLDRVPRRAPFSHLRHRRRGPPVGGTHVLQPGLAGQRPGAGRVAEPSA